MHPVLARIEQLGVVPALVTAQVDQAIPLAEALLDGDLPCIEITLRSPGALDTLSAMSSVRGLLVGAGTVLNPKQADEAISAGAKFIVSPGMSESLIRHCQERDIPIIPGATTPTEIMLAIELGLECVKFFPAAALGGLPLVKALHGPFLGMRFMPTGGINSETMVPYLMFKPVLAVGGTWMLRSEWLKSGNYDMIANVCASTRSRAQAARGKIDPTEEF